MKYKDCLKLPMQENDAGAKTIGEYIKKLLLKLWDEKEEFSVKRPFGNSGWDYELYYALANEGVISSITDKGRFSSSNDNKSIILAKSITLLGIAKEMIVDLS